MDAPNGKTTAIEHFAPVQNDSGGLTPGDSPTVNDKRDGTGVAAGTEPPTADQIEERNKGWFAYLKTRNFWIVLLLGSVHFEFDPGKPTLTEILQASAGALYHWHEYLLWAARCATFLHPCLPDFLELSSSQPSLYFHYPL